jgi:hypothetical protein
VDPVRISRQAGDDRVAFDDIGVVEVSRSRGGHLFGQLMRIISASRHFHLWQRREQKRVVLMSRRAQRWSSIEMT